MDIPDMSPVLRRLGAWTIPPRTVGEGRRISLRRIVEIGQVAGSRADLSIS
jgi:hypothetical protein